ncbi:uncharacterized protein LOC119071791 [Bradysia coprophila]|uniref:uncharacterized protein LOC119071791 n=1 Tax=Bradysia coprophila TaxID=38358 RepID=UPI00187DBF72|nr:uncharacterized protein LOC119071791 [Bradysia coprophila]
MNHLILLVLSVSVMAFTSNACQFGSEAIQTVYDRFELFRTTKAFDPTDPKVPLQQYSFLHSYKDDGEMRLAVEISGVYIVEYFIFDGDNKLQTKNGQYKVKGGANLNYKRDENGEFSFDDSLNQKKFKSSIRSIDAELPSDFEEGYKQILVDLNAIRKKMFDFKNSLSKEDLELVESFELTPSPNGDGFTAKYQEKDGLGVTASKYNGSNDIFGLFMCENNDQKYNIVDGKVVADGEPFVPLNRFYVQLIKPIPIKQVEQQ